MSRLSWVQVALVCFLVFCTQRSLPQQAATQSPAASAASEHAENTSNAARHISLDVVATDSTGKAVSSLQQQDFTLLDNNQPQKMASFEALQGTTADPPVEVVLLIDLRPPLAHASPDSR